MSSSRPCSNRHGPTRRCVGRPGATRTPWTDRSLSDPPRLPTIEPLAKHHERAAFSCGDEALDRYFHRKAAQDRRKRVAVPFVLLDPAAGEVAGFYTLSALSIDLGTLPDTVARKLPRYPLVPATLLGRLAVDLRHRGKGNGALLLIDALKRSLDLSRQVASFAVVVDAKDDAALDFYRRYDFTPFPDQPRRLFLTMARIQAIF